jgi:hypothetical protein
MYIELDTDLHKNIFHARQFMNFDQKLQENRHKKVIFFISVKISIKQVHKCP